MDKLIVEVQMYGPTETSGALESLGIMEILGSDCPSAVPVVLDESVCVVRVPELDGEIEVTWRAKFPTEDEELDEVDAATDVKAECAPSPIDTVSTDLAAAFWIDNGIATGQKLQTCRPWSQNRSSSNL